MGNQCYSALAGQCYLPTAPPPRQALVCFPYMRRSAGVRGSERQPTLMPLDGVQENAKGHFSLSHWVTHDM